MAVYTRWPVFGLSLYVVVVLSLLVMMSEAQTSTTSTAIKSNTGLPLCTCDMTGKDCDVNCCCDKDCDDDDRKAFSRCIDEQTISDSQMCVKKSLVFFDNTPYTTSTRGSLLCIHIDNFQERNFFKVPETVVKEADFDKFRATYGGYSYNDEAPRQTFHGDFYRSGDPILTVYRGEVQGVLGLPAPLGTSKCADNNPVAFLYNQEFECEREVNLQDECSSDAFIDANLYFRGFKLIISPAVLTNYSVFNTTQSTNTSGPVTTASSVTTGAPVTTPVAAPGTPLSLYNSTGVIEVDLYSVTCFDENGLQQPSCDFNVTNGTMLPKPHYDAGGKDSARCRFVVTGVEYVIKHGGKSGLEKAYVMVKLTDLPDEIQSITQKFKITFYKGGDRNIFKRSGRPGYVVGQPVMAGRLKKNTTVQGQPSRQVIDLHKDRSKWLTVVSNSINGDCISSPEHRVPVTFGDEMRAGCKVRVSLQNLTNNCAFIQDAVLDALRGNKPPTHVATFGDSSITVVGDWVTIQGLYTQPAKAQKAQDGVCRNLVVGMLTQIVYADIGSLQQPQAKILGVLVTYQTDMVKFQCVGRYCQPGNTDLQNIEVVSTVSFIDISTAPTASSGKRPTLPLRLPSDFFYPFT